MRVLNGALQIQYRGRLASCNYDCGYCPFAKRKDSRAQLARDRANLERFVCWTDYPAPVAILFTPWGEALTRRYYQQAIRTLSHLPQVQRVAVQTNLSAPLGWLEQCDPERVALWSTYHPSQTRRERFLARCTWLLQHGIRFSVGMVGNRADLAEAEALRAALPETVYLWINVNRAQQAAYTTAELARWQAIDPLFALNLPRYPSGGRPCLAGSQSISVAGDGTVQRCHFVKKPLGNLYQAAAYVPDTGPCPNTECHCHIGYIQLEHLQLYGVFGDGLLERIPVQTGLAQTGAPLSLSVSRTRSFITPSSPP